MKTIEQGRIPTLIHDIVREFSTAESFDKNLTEIWLLLKAKYPDLANKEICANCTASMLADWYTIDIIDTKLMLKLRDVVYDRLERGMDFPTANRLKVVKLPNLSDTERHRTTKLRFLGQLAKVLENGKHKGEWLITNRGFAYLRNEDVLSRVKSFRNRITERTEETTRISKVIAQSRENIDYQRKSFYEAEPQEDKIL